jgi:hypothetical protein
MIRPYYCLIKLFFLLILFHFHLYYIHIITSLFPVFIYFLLNPIKFFHMSSFLCPKILNFPLNLFFLLSILTLHSIILAFFAPSKISPFQSIPYFSHLYSITILILLIFSPRPKSYSIILSFPIFSNPILSPILPSPFITSPSMHYLFPSPFHILLILTPIITSTSISFLFHFLKSPYFPQFHETLLSITHYFIRSPLQKY